MVSADHDRRGKLTARHEIVERHAELRPFALTQPADARRQSLKVHLLPCHRDPPAEVRILRKQLERQLVGAMDVRWITGERDPAEWPLPFAEQRANVLGHEPRE